MSDGDGRDLTRRPQCRPLRGRRRPAVLDVQPAENFEDWHVPGSVNLDIAQDLQEDPDAAKASLSAIPEDLDVIVVRTAGAAALLAADHLRALGYDVKTLACHRPTRPG